MQSSTYQFVRSLFAITEFRPDGPNKRPLVEHTLGAQRENYMTLCAQVYTVANKQSGYTRYADIPRLHETCTNHISQLFEKRPLGIFGDEDSLTILGAIPVIFQIDASNPPTNVVASRQDDLFVCFAAGLFYETARAGITPNPDNKSLIDCEIASYAGFRVVDEISRAEESSIASRTKMLADQTERMMVSQTESLLKSFDERFDAHRQAITERTGSLATMIETLHQRAEAGLSNTEVATQKAASFESQIIDLATKVDDLGVTTDSKIVDADDKLAGFLEAAKARSTYENLKIHWIDRANQAWWALTGSYVLLIILLIGLPTWAMVELDSVLRFARKVTEATTILAPPTPTASGQSADNTAAAATTNVQVVESNPIAIAVMTVSRLVIITVPLALYFWLIRLVVRFNTRSMLLMDDARQRATIIETYYKMIEEMASTKEDRALILQAICRPPPGHGGDSVEPPNFTEVLERATGRPTK